MDIKSLVTDISNRCGLSEDIVRRVQNAETEYIIDRLRKGEKVRIPSRGTYHPDRVTRIGATGEVVHQIRVRYTVSDNISNSLSDLTDFEKAVPNEDDVIPKGIKTLQIDTLI